MRGDYRGAVITTYPEMNAKIVGLLRLSDDPLKLYAAQRIEELKQMVELLKLELKRKPIDPF
jgi:hypothetical protein